MAISIDSYPSAANHFAYRPVVWTVSSNDVNIIRCIADVYVNGSLSTTIEKSPNIGTTDTFTFDLQSVLQDNLTAYAPNFNTGIGKLYADASNALRYNVRFFEVLDNGTTYDTSWAESGAGTSYVDSTTVYNPAYAYNGTLRHEETQLMTNYKNGGTYAGFSRFNKLTTTFLGSSTNKARKIKRGDFAILTGYELTGSAIQGRLLQYNSANSNISTGTSTTLASTNRLWQYAIDTTILEPTCAKFLMRLESTVPVAITNYASFDVVEENNDYVSLYWLNDLGGFDYYLFRDGQVKVYEGKGNTYTKPLTTSYNVYDFGTTVLSKESKIGLKAVSEVLDRNEADAISNLFTHSVKAWVYINSQFIPVIVADGGITTIDTNEGTYRANVELIYSNNLKVQRY